METIRNKHIVVAGATGTIGWKTTEMLSAGGAIVYITGRDANQLSELAARANIPAERVIEVDLAEAGDIEKLATSVIAACEAPDVLINCTGIGIIKPLESLTIEDFNRSLQVNLVGPFLLMKAFIPAMKAKNKGLIINLPGVLGKTPMAGASAYAASKYGLNGMMKSLREELKRTNIRITQVFLGGTDSRFWDTIDLKVQRDKMIAAEEAAKTLWFLCQQPLSAVVSEMVVQPFNHQVI